MGNPWLSSPSAQVQNPGDPVAGCNPPYLFQGFFRAHPFLSHHPLHTSPSFSFSGFPRFVLTSPTTIPLHPGFHLLQRISSNSYEEGTAWDLCPLPNLNSSPCAFSTSPSSPPLIMLYFRSPDSSVFPGGTASLTRPQVSLLIKLSVFLRPERVPGASGAQTTVLLP